MRGLRSPRGGVLRTLTVVLMDFASNCSNPRRLGVAGLAALFALLSGCFSEPASELEATDGNCDPGDFGCPCLDGGCQPDLTCTPENTCMAQDDCTPGSAYCECDQGRCGPGLACEANVCRDRGGTTLTTSSSDSNTTTGTSDTTETSTTGTSSTSSTTAQTETSTTVADTTDGTESSTTAPPASCPEDSANCGACFACTHGNECELEFESCDGEQGCPTIAACMQSCAVDGLCFDNCCVGELPDAVSAALALQACREDTCIAPGPCRSYAPFDCSE